MAANERLRSLDVFRGLTVAGMLLVNNPGSWSAIYPPLAHAAWHGWTPTDLIFPFFLFIVGVTTHLSREARRARGMSESALTRQAIQRGAIILLCGWALAAFPFVPLTRITALRIPGVLPRIGVVSIAAALLTQRTTLRQQVLTVIALLYGYWFAMTLLPVPGQEGPGILYLDDPSRTLAAWVDRALLDGHLWRQSKTWDPEGILSTFPAIGTALLGTFAGRWLGSPRSLEVRLNGLFAVGALATMLGAMWGWSFPINKGLWTSSYVLLTAGLAALAIATITWLGEGPLVRRLTTPALAFGVNPLLAFLGSGLMAKVMGSLWKVEVSGEMVPVQSVIYREIFRSWLPPHDASLAFALCFVLLWWLLLEPLRRRGIIVKV
jgi:predicted acyltransferase